MQIRHSVQVATALAVAVAAAACSGSSSNTARQPSSNGSAGPRAVVALNIGLFGALSDAGLILAKDKGYFEEQDLNVTFTPSQSAPTIISLVAAGKLDAAGTAPTPGLFNAINQGVKLKIAADKGRIDPTHSWTSLVVRKDLYDSGAITTLADLKAKRIGVPDVNTSTGAELGKALESVGLSVDDVKLVAGNPATTFVSLQNKAIDAAALQEPFIALSAAQKVGQVMTKFGEVLPNGQNGILVFGEKLAANKDLSERFMTAYRKGLADYNAAFPVSGTPQGQEDVIAKLVGATSVKNAALYPKMAPVLFDPDGKVNTASIDAFQEFFKSIGSQTTIVPASKYLVDAQ